MEPLKVSIIIPLYNRVSFIKETINSIGAQNYPYWEAIIVDDGSTDGSFELVKDMAEKDHRIRLLRRDRAPKGAPTCRNIGAKHARSDFIIFMDSDDLLAPFCLEQRVTALQQHPDYDFLVFPMLLFEKAVGDTNLLWNIDTEEDDLARFLRWDPVWQTMCPIYKRSSFLQGGGFDENLFFWQDYELHVRLLYSNFKYKKLLETTPDCYYRKHNNETLSQTKTSHPEKLQLMQGVVKHFADEIWARGKGRSQYARCISAVLFWLSLSWITEYKSFDMAKNNWKFCFHKKLISPTTYCIGISCLVIKFVQSQSLILYLLLKPLYKLFVLLLPTIYRDNRVTTQRVIYPFVHSHSSLKLFSTIL